MTDSNVKANLSRRRLLQAAVIIPAAAVPTLAVASPAHAGYLDPISRSSVMARARNWYDRDIQYEISGKASDMDGTHLYWRNCAGFVAMAWHSHAPGPSIPLLAQIAPKIKWGHLRPGDIVNSIDESHCMLYHKRGGTGYVWMYDLANPSYDMRHARHSVASLKARGYQPRRYPKIRNG
ncbi:hypothetical protein [Glycomyces sp. NPDC047010]|uniref:hypothetical protein n=1 Tax=Glycomyces sp. NPDC047010 TaxID=3155023 RepID=UPI0033E0BCC6